MNYVTTLVAIIAVLFVGSANAFQVTPSTSVLATRSTASSTTSLFFFGREPKDDGSPGDYLCKDCGYVYTKGPQAWAKETDKYKCPPCGAPKFRFKKIAKGSANGKVCISLDFTSIFMHLSFFLTLIFVHINKGGGKKELVLST